MTIARTYDPDASAVILGGDSLETLSQIPDESVQLIITSPPYNIGKDYETVVPMQEYLERQRLVLEQCVRVLKPRGNICWQVGFSKDRGELVPLDAVFYPLFKELGLVFRNRIVWTFGHGAHANKRFSGRHETILWFAKSLDSHFNLDPVRVPQKYPGKRHYKGPKRGEYSGNPLGKNPGDVWDIPNVKAHHVEKTSHQCQFPIGLIQRLVRALSEDGDWVLDPFAGVGSAACGALIESRRAIACEILPSYQRILEDRVIAALNGTLRYRDVDQPIQVPNPKSDVGKRISW